MILRCGLQKKGTQKLPQDFAICLCHFLPPCSTVTLSRISRNGLLLLGFLLPCVAASDTDFVGDLDGKQLRKNVRVIERARDNA